MSQADQLLCTKCRLELPETNDHLTPEHNQSHNKFAGKVPVRYVVSYAKFTKGGVMQRVVHQLKYRGQKDAALALGRWYGHILRGSIPISHDIDLLVGVPLHKHRQKQRGYNQADQIAEGLALSMALPTSKDVLIRKQFGGSQTKKNRLARWANVSSVFDVADANTIRDKHVAVVDDVLTTGATLEACAVALLQAGCREVSIITLAVTQ